MFDSESICADISASTAASFELQNHSVVGGGDINQAYRLTGRCGRSYFLKLNRVDKLEMFTAEAEGLTELAQAKAIRVPAAVCCGQAANHAYIVIEHIALSAGSDSGSARMGQQLAQLHQVDSQGRGHGWHRENTIGTTPQYNDWSSDWLGFLRQHRIGYQLDLAAKQGASKHLLEKGQLLLEGMDIFFDSYQPRPSLLHGDLWAGNASFDEEGAPVIYDPAVYYGDRETDIAMTELFGGFSQDFYNAYEQIWPLDSGYSWRRDIYKLYHVLNHFNMFGGGYGSQAENIIDKLLIYLR